MHTAMLTTPIVRTQVDPLQAMQLNGCAFMFKSKQQSKVITDACGSELIAASMCVEDLVWARKLVKEIRRENPP